MEPLEPNDPELRALARAVANRAGGLGRHLHPATLAAVADLLRTVNCYYSNLIEGHDTHPVAIERAMHQEYASGSAVRNLQIEALAHIETQKLLEELLDAEPTLNVCEPDLLRWIHQTFYERLPAELRLVRDPETGREETILPGEFRDFDVRVGDHIAPPHADVRAALIRFSSVYDPGKHEQVEALVRLGAAHHRLLWIHPFGDGNGRVTRLMTDAYLRRIGAGGHGLWTSSRGLARRGADYKAALAAADAQRWDDYDGRGARSHRALVEFVRFFLEVCADQVAYMEGLLAVDGLADRVRGYGRGRELGVLPDERGRVDRAARFHPAMSHLLEHLMYRGAIPRGEVARLLHLEERTARRVVRRLGGEGFLISTSTRAPITVRIPAYAAPYLLPGLYGPQT